jgi:radical SAM protein (TIGR01212 family)
MNYKWGTKRRFNAASNYIRETFGTRIQKVSINAGFTCPNRDGTKSTGGCTFCNNNAFNPSYCNPEKSIRQQIQEGVSFHETRYKSAKGYLAYFQAYSNTYGSVAHLESVYREALNNDRIIGLIIGSRPDCIDSKILKLLEKLSKETYLVLELGIESVYNQTLERINRGHTFEETISAIKACADRNINTGGHIIFGLPGESREMMMESVTVLSDLPLKSIKFHQLQIIKNTKIGFDYQVDPSQFRLFSINEYVDFIVQFLERLNPDFIIERLAGETQPWHNIGERWNLRYDQVLQLIEKKMSVLDTWQGKYYIK